jgi:hypothetical protein
MVEMLVSEVKKGPDPFPQAGKERGGKRAKPHEPGLAHAAVRAACCTGFERAHSAQSLN